MSLANAVQSWAIGRIVTLADVAGAQAALTDLCRPFVAGAIFIPNASWFIPMAFRIPPTRCWFITNT